MIYFRQCKLQRGNAFTTSWIPEKYTKKGKHIELKDNDVWVDGWLVTEVGNKRLQEEYVVTRSQDYKRQRKASDI
jgi:hypothetical protein